MTAAAIVTVAIPVLDGAPMLADTLAAVRAQCVAAELELLVADSGSTDGSRELAVGQGATVIDIPRKEFSHGGTRNLLISQARGSHVAFLTQDAIPSDESWLARLLDGFDLAADIGLVFGPYRARPDASLMVRRELDVWFSSFSSDGKPRVDRAGDLSADRASRDRRAFFTNANGCVARGAWEQVPFRAVSYAEDQMLARDMMSAGWAKAYQPTAVVTHSHDYPPGRQLRRAFDESRALREVHGYRAHGGPARLALVVQREVRDDMGLLRLEGFPLRRCFPVLLHSVAHHFARVVGATLGSRADRLPARVRRLLSLERRGGFDPQC